MATAFNFRLPGAGPVARRLPRGRSPTGTAGPAHPRSAPALLADLRRPLEARLSAASRSHAMKSRWLASTHASRATPQWAAGRSPRPLLTSSSCSVASLLGSAVATLQYDWGHARPQRMEPIDLLEVTAEQRAKGVKSTAAEYRDVVKHDRPPAGSGGLRDTLSLSGRAFQWHWSLCRKQPRSDFARRAEEDHAVSGRTEAEFSYSLTDAQQWLPDARSWTVTTCFATAR